MKKRNWLGIGILAAGAAIAAALVLFRSGPEQGASPPKAPLVETAPARALDGALEIYATGTVEAGSEVRLAAQIGGRVVEVHPNFESGLRVAADEVLVRIEPADYENAVKRAQAAVKRQEVAVAQAQERAAVAENEYERFQRQADALDLAPVPTNEALVLREPQLEAARAELERARATLADARLALGRTELRAPMDAWVVEDPVEVGDYVSTGMEVGRLHGLGYVEVRVPLGDAQASLIPGLWTPEAEPAQAEVEQEVGGLPFRWQARVARAEATVEEGTRRYEVILTVEDPVAGGRALRQRTDAGIPPLLPGAFVEVTITGADVGPHFSVPRAALRREDRLWVVGDGDRIEVVPVEVLQYLDERALVAGALSEGAPLVVSDLRGVTDGMRIRRATSVKGRAEAPGEGGLAASGDGT